MTRFQKILFVLAALCALALPWGQSVAGGGDPKVVIYHYPPGNPANAHTIIVGAPAVTAHVGNHGDCLGPCPCGPSDPPDDVF